MTCRIPNTERFHLPILSVALGVALAVTAVQPRNLWAQDNSATQCSARIVACPLSLELREKQVGEEEVERRVKELRKEMERAWREVQSIPRGPQAFQQKSDLSDLEPPS